MPRTNHATLPARVLLFATARTAAGTGRVEWPVPARGVPADRLVDELVERFPALRKIVPASRLLRNGALVRRPGELVRPGDEFAIHPPYGGG